LTLEEAVEIILGGQSATPCPDCEAGELVIQIHDEILCDACKTCGGVGALRVPEYDKACDVLGRPRPTLADAAGIKIGELWTPHERAKAMRTAMKNLDLKRAFSVSSEISMNWEKPKS
jgi:hypothetical protein